MSLRSQQDRTAGLIQALDMRLIPRAMTWIEKCNTVGYRVLIHQGRRTFSEQDGLFAKGRTVLGERCKHDGVYRPAGSCPKHPMGLTVTNAEGGESYHNFGLAWDFVAMDKNGSPLWDMTPYELLAYEGEKLGLEWGGRWPGRKKDLPHLQLSLAPISKLLKIAPKGFIPSSWTPPPPKAEVA